MLAVITLVWMKMCVCLLPNKDQTSVQTANPAKSDGKKGNICPSPVSDINTADDNPDMWCKLLLYNSIKQVLSQLAQWLQQGLYYHQTFPDSESRGVEAVKLASSSICLVRQLHMRGLSCMLVPEFLC